MPTNPHTRNQTTLPLAPPRKSAGRTVLIEGAVFVAAAALTVASAIGIKSAKVAGEPVPSLSRVRFTEPSPASQAPTSQATTSQTSPAAPKPVAGVTPAPKPRAQTPTTGTGPRTVTRWFDGRPVRPARTIEMVVTGYSPDSKSCGVYADGQTATLHSVWTNGFRLVAADPKVLPYGSMLTIPGYAPVDRADPAAGQTIVPVLDCGGAIKGNRLDLLFPTHEAARKWGVRRVQVTVWEYADGKPAPNPRTVR